MKVWNMIIGLLQAIAISGAFVCLVVKLNLVLDSLFRQIPVKLFRAILIIILDLITSGVAALVVVSQFYYVFTGGW